MREERRRLKSNVLHAVDSDRSSRASEVPASGSNRTWTGRSIPAAKPKLPCPKNREVRCAFLEVVRWLLEVLRRPLQVLHLLGAVVARSPSVLVRLDKPACA